MAVSNSFRQLTAVILIGCLVTSTVTSQEAKLSSVEDNEIIDNDGGGGLPQYEFSRTSSDLSIKYSIVASKVVRPSTIYQVVASLEKDSLPCRMMVSISRRGVAVTNNVAELQAGQSHGILLKVPPDNTGKAAQYVLRVEGHRLKHHGGGLVFEHEAPLQFSRNFLSITLSANRAVFNAEQTIYIRVLFLTTALKPYEGIVDLYLIDPDGYVIRKWNSKELNVGVLTEQYNLPEYPKVRTDKRLTDRLLCLVSKTIPSAGWLLEDSRGRRRPNGRAANQSGEVLLAPLVRAERRHAGFHPRFGRVR